jgi:hypothetical protein
MFPDNVLCDASDSEDVKRRFASLIEGVLRSSAEGNAVGAADQLEATVQRLDRCVLVRLHWRTQPSACADQPSPTEGERATEVISCRVYRELGDRTVVIMVTRDAPMAPEVPDREFVH